jgi:hypothetical protein
MQVTPAALSISVQMSSVEMRFGHMSFGLAEVP